MKKAIFLLGVMLVICLCIFTGCGDSKNNNNNGEKLIPDATLKDEEVHEHRMPKFNPERKTGRAVRQHILIKSVD